MQMFLIIPFRITRWSYWPRTDTLRGYARITSKGNNIMDTHTVLTSKAVEILNDFIVGLYLDATEAHNNGDHALAADLMALYNAHK